MSTVTRHANTCKIKQIASNRIVEAEVQDFREKEMLVVIVNQSVKLSMRWNGRMYEGRMAAMDFETEGPVVSKTQTGVRG